MGSPIDMNVDVFWETSVSFLKSVVLQLSPKYSQSNANLNVKSRSKFNQGSHSIFKLKIEEIRGENL